VSEVKRTCTRCGTVRYVPTDIAEAKPLKSRSRWSRSVLELIPGTKSGQRFTADNAMTQQHNLRLADERRCRTCGSESFTEEVAA
jgi:ribosomal protein L37E